MRSILLSVVFATVLVLSSSCSKNEGPGGTSTIVGRVWIEDYNADFSQLLNEYWAQEQDVYLSYGSDTIYSQRFKTGYDGSYRFQFLREGEYTLYAYSKDKTGDSSSGQVAVKVKVYIDDKDNTFSAPQITILD